MTRIRQSEAGLLLLATLFYAVVLHLPLIAQGPPTPDPLAHVLATRGEAIVSPPWWFLPLDDAYILVRFAQEAAHGRFVSWGEGEPSSAATSPAFVLLLLPAQFLLGSLASWSIGSKLIGVLSLWAVGLAGARLLRVLGAPPPWPLAAGLALVWSGPIGWAAVSGMDNGLACAVLLGVLALWIELGGQGTLGDSAPSRMLRRRRWLLLVAIAGLPLVRPDFGVLTVVAGFAILLARPARVPRLVGLVLPLPGLGLGLLYQLRTGELQPVGAIAKSVMALPFLTVGERLEVVGRQMVEILLPTYLGNRSVWLPPVVGVLAVGCAVVVLLAQLPDPTGSRVRQLVGSGQPLLVRLSPLVLVWAILIAIAPFSVYLGWHHLRHHHPGLAATWVLAFAALYLLSQGVARRQVKEDPSSQPATPQLWRVAALLVAVLPLLNLPALANEYRVNTIRLFHNNGVAGLWLAAQGGDKSLLLHDAGVLRIEHPGPAIDFIGLGTPRFVHPQLHGMGAVVETLAREQRLPDLVASRLDLLETPSLFGDLVLPPRTVLGQPPVLLATFRKEALEHTRLVGGGVDLAFLDDERRAGLLWDPPPSVLQPSLSRALLGSRGTMETHGCRPLRGRLGVSLPADVTSIRIRATSEPEHRGRVTVAVGERGGPGSPLEPVVELPAAPSEWTEARVDLPSSGGYLWLLSSGEGTPCIESLAFD